MTAKPILVVDDDDLVRIAVSTIVRACGHNPVEARNLATAISASKEQAFDLVITDNYMPRAGDGIELIQYFNRLYGTRLPIILHSSEEPHNLAALLDVFPQVTFVRKADNTLSDTIRTILSA